MKIIAIEGIDGSGKTHQFGLLKDHIANNGYKFLTLEFPNYKNIVGKEIGKFLSGEHSVSANTLDPKSMALWFTVDRKITFEANKKKLEDVDFLLLNRYTLSSAVYQVLRAEKEEQEELLSWILELEHKAMCLPEPDLYIILDVHTTVAQNNIDKKGKREYLKEKKKDVYEDSPALLKEARNLYLKGAQLVAQAEVIACSDAKEMFQDQDIFAKIRDTIKPLLF
ncbi:dTMP kinase [Candidatus Riflebacteria bacterium]